MSARAELISMVNDIRLNFDRGQGTLGEVADRVMEIARRVEQEQLEAVDNIQSYTVAAWLVGPKPEENRLKSVHVIRVDDLRAVLDTPEGLFSRRGRHGLVT